MAYRYFWIIAKDENNKDFLIYGGETEEQARMKGLETLHGVDFIIKDYPTIDLGTASAYWRGAKLDKGEGLKRATQRIGHEKSIKRYLKRRSNADI